MFFLLLLKYEQQEKDFSSFLRANKKDLSLSAVLVDGEVKKIKKTKKTRTTRCDDDDAETTTTTTAKYCASLFV